MTDYQQDLARATIPRQEVCQEDMRLQCSSRKGRMYRQPTLYQATTPTRIVEVPRYTKNQENTRRLPRRLEGKEKGRIVQYRNKSLPHGHSAPSTVATGSSICPTLGWQSSPAV